MFAFLLVTAWSCDSDKEATNVITDEQQSAQMENIIAADLVVEDTDMYFDMIIEKDKAGNPFCVSIFSADAIVFDANEIANLV